MKSPGSLSRIDCPATFSRLMEGVGSFPSSAKNRSICAIVVASGFPAVDVRQLPRLETIEEQGFENSTFSFEAEESVTHSPDCFPGILIRCKELEYCRPRRRQCDEYYHARLLGRQWSRRTRFLAGVRGYGQGASPYLSCVLIWVDVPKAR